MLPPQVFTRSRNNLLGWTQSSIEFSNWVDGVRQTPSIYPMANHGHKAELLDVMTPGYKALRKQGKVIMNPVKLTKVDRSYVPCSLIVPVPEFGKVDRRCNGDLVSYYENEAIFDTPLKRLNEDERGALIDAVFVEAMKKANQAEVMGGEFLFELNKTVEMVKRPLSSLQKFAARLADKHARIRRNARSPSEASKAITDSWLESQFGWSPLVGDVFKILEMTSEKLGDYQERAVARSSSRITLDSERERAGVTFWARIESNVAASLHYEAVYSGGVVYDKVNKESSSELMSRLGFRARDLPITMWNLAPQSWLIDYFTNVGSWLEALVPNPDIVIKGFWVTEQIDQFKTTKLTSPRWLNPAGVWYSNVGSPGSSQVRDRLYSRYVALVIPSTPRLRQSFIGALQAANSAAFACGRLVRQIKRI